LFLGRPATEARGRHARCAGPGWAAGFRFACALTPKTAPGERSSGCCGVEVEAGTGARKRYTGRAAPALLGVVTGECAGARSVHLFLDELQWGFFR